jgi:transposase InsO family protein
MTEKDQAWALFWCSLLRPLIDSETEPEDTPRVLREIASHEHLFPDGRRRKVSPTTLRRKWRVYQQQGFEALARKPRCDRGQTRRYRPEIIQRAIALKKDQPLRSNETINQFLQQEFGQRLPKATLYRHLQQAGATRVKLGVTSTKVRCRWTREQTNALWLGDFEEGPYVLHEGQPVRTHLSAFIDCHSRYLVTARYYYRQTLDILMDTLLRAWAVHGASRELYLDNAKVYDADALKAACYALNIRLRHRPPGDPAPGGLIERFFQTVQTQFEAEVRAGEILTLERLNRAFTAWLEVSYHPRPNSETGQSPMERYRTGEKFTRQVDLQRVLEFFLKRVERTVDRKHGDVQLEKCYFRVADRSLRGDKVEVRYDPFAPLDKVFLYSRSGAYLGTAERYERERGAHGEAPPPAKPGKPQHNYLDLLVGQHEQSLSERSRGIDYRQVAPTPRGTFGDFAQTLAQLLGRRGGLSAFSTDELETLSKLYARLGCSEALLRQAVEQAAEKTLPAIAVQLQRLNDRQGRTKE